MNYQISSKQIGNPILVGLLRRLDRVFGQMNREFYVIGATARDILIQCQNIKALARKTRDLDIAIAIPGWDAFEEIKNELINDGFEKSLRERQRFYCDGYEIDIVPYGNIKSGDDNIYWPPEMDIAMSVKGFSEILSNAINVTIDDDLVIRIASLHGLFILKFNAWLDRHLAHNKDASDMSYIIDNYFVANLNREMPNEVYDFDDFDEYIVGAYWLAHDIRGILSPEQISFYRDQILCELEKAESSRLINQILESSGKLTYEQVWGAWKRIADVFQC